MTSPVDTFTSNDVKELFYDKYILILGDSVVRGLYKDLVKLSISNDLLNEDELRIKGENRFYGDRLIDGGVQKGLTNGIEYEEVREYTSSGRLRIRFYFITRSYSSYMKHIVFNDIKNQTIKPDIIIMNSCVWDISRYGIYAMRAYKRNIDHIMGSFRQMLPDTLFLWLSALPVSNSSKGGVIVPKAEYIRPILPGLIRDGNYHCSQMCDIHNVLYIDFHTIFSTMLHLRRPDGIHWSAIGNRLMNEIILNHIKAYYYDVKDFKCPLLRGELGNKINQFKERIKNSKYNSKKNYLDLDISDNENEEGKIGLNSNKNDKKNNLLKLKRKRNDDIDDDDNSNDNEKENNRQHRKVIIQSSTITNDQQKIIVKKSINQFELEQDKILDNQMTKFDHEYCDIMYDNEFEGLYLLHFSSCDIETSEEIQDLQLSNEIIQNQNKQIIENIPEVFMKSTENIIKSVPLRVPSAIGEKVNEINYIVLSSDDEDETLTHNVSSAITNVLPIYLLNRL